MSRTIEIKNKNYEIEMTGSQADYTTYFWSGMRVPS